MHNKLSQSSLRKSMITKNKPDWMTITPIIKNYYVGIGKQNEPKKKKRKNMFIY